MKWSRGELGTGEASPALQWMALLAATAMIAMVAYLDRWIQPNVSVGLLYIVPLLVVSPWLRSEQVILICAVCSVLREHFSPLAWQGEWSVRLVVVFAAFAAASLVVSALAGSRRLAQERLGLLEQEMERRREAEDRLRAVVDSSPLGVFALNASGRVEMCNASGARLMGYAYLAELEGRPLSEHLPLLAELQEQAGREGFSTVLECPARRANGEQFWAYVWLSSYGPPVRRQLAVVVWDGSEIFRDREGSGWELLLTGSRLSLAAMSHEMKNLTVAALRCEERVKAVAGPQAERELAALRTALNGIQEVAKGALAMGLGQMKRVCALDGALEEASILLSPLLEEHGIRLVKELPEGRLPTVRADRRALVQVIVNLAENSARVLQGRSDRAIHWRLEEDGPLVRLRVYDTGPGVARPEHLFQPFQRGAQASGLGLAISRVMLRSFEGDLRYEKGGEQPSFVIVLLREGYGSGSGDQREEGAATPAARGG